MATPAPPGPSIYGSPSTGPTSVFMVEPRPTTAAWLVAVGGWFVLLEGMVYLFTGVFYLTDGAGPIAGTLAWTGLIEALVGAFMFGVALLISSEPNHHVANGLLALVLVGMSFVFGFGGFFIGALLAAIGGFVAMFWKPTGPSMLVTVTPVRAPTRKS